MYLIFSCALVSPNSRSITFWWEVKVKVLGATFANGLPRGRGHAWRGPKIRPHC